MKRKLVLLLVMTTIALCGCSNLKPGLTRYTMPEETQTVPVDTEAKSAIERMAAEKHEAPELSHDFVSQYMDMASFNELKLRTAAGIKVTQDTAAMTEEEYQLWKDIIDTQELNQYTVDDLEKKEAELNKILEDMATEQGLSISSLAEKYGMTEDELNQFVNDQAEKYVEEDVEDTEGTDKEEDSDTTKDTAKTTGSGVGEGTDLSKSTGTSNSPENGTSTSTGTAGSGVGQGTDLSKSTGTSNSTKNSTDKSNSANTGSSIGSIGITSEDSSSN